ncbi:hypothetical protein ABZ714_21940 [Streptomyces sp. NPDC006798]|uniref:hypothetical protein n=1 Tax=Streptomyces sp. NPDC006798 TaxID=3155462 RepID=UPI0033E87A71
MSSRKYLSALGAGAMLLGGPSAVGAPAASAAPAAAPASPPPVVRPLISCTPENVDGYTGRTSCTNLGTVSAYRVRVTCRRTNGTLFTVYGVWRVAGYSVATCSTTGAATVWSVGTDY